MTSPGPIRTPASARLYLVLDTEVCGYDRLWEILKESVSAGVDCVQLRDKYGSARGMTRFSTKVRRYLRGRVPYIINDRVDVAVAVEADGVHLGQDDVPVAWARKWLGKKFIIGASCQTLPQALQARKWGATYIGFGSVFKTMTKPDRQGMNLELLARVSRKISIPVFAIGGIDSGNVGKVLAAGVERVAVTRAICLAPDAGQATRTLKASLQAKNFKSRRNNRARVIQW